MRYGLALIVLFAFAAGALGGEIDADCIRTRIIAQEALLRDMDAKLSHDRTPDTAKGITSLRKNAVVTVGGTIDTRYYYNKAKVDTSLAANKAVNGVPQWNASPDRVQREEFKHGDLTIYNAKLIFKIDINDHFDAYVRLSLHDLNRTRVSGIAQNYWVRWKNICNSGFGVLVGRDSIAFGDNETTGVIMNYTGGQEGVGEYTWRSGLISNFDNADPIGGAAWGDGMLLGNSLVPYHTGFDFGRTTQITPYWESKDGKFKAEVSLFQSRERLTGDSYGYADGATTHYRSINYGLGTGTVKLTWRPAEGLKLTASAINFNTNSDRNNGVFSWKGNGPGGGGWNQLSGIRTTSNNSAVNLAVQYRPVFLKKLKVWTQ
ncbi:MAG: hypothetical protein LUC93_01220 [Planctomycetaceae bacterium]|nr:hypothetical protein [Planctomycetaceae bacterium]